MLSQTCIRAPNLSINPHGLLWPCLQPLIPVSTACIQKHIERVICLNISKLWKIHRRYCVIVFGTSFPSTGATTDLPCSYESVSQQHPATVNFVERKMYKKRDTCFDSISFFNLYDRLNIIVSLIIIIIIIIIITSLSSVSLSEDSAGDAPMSREVKTAPLTQKDQSRKEVGFISEAVI